MNQFKYSFDNKRYHTLNYYNKNKYGEKIYKAVLDCGFTCPNKDGTKGYGGCIFCDSGSGYFTNGLLSVKEQLIEEIKRITRKNGENAAITAYFQANTNTYCSANELSELCNNVLELDMVQGISIGTRADCLQEEILDYLEELSKKTDLAIELGMQSIHDDTLTLINRGYLHEEFVEGYIRLKNRGIRICVHIINGLPGENDEMMLETAQALAELNPDAVKIQMLHVIQGTKLERLYNQGEFQLLTKEEYIDIVVKQLELLPQEIVVERITGDGDKSKLVGPLWSTDKISVLGGIDKRMAELDTWQGRRCKTK